MKKPTKKELEEHIEFLEQKVLRLENTIKWREDGLARLNQNIGKQVESRIKDRIDEYDRMYEALKRQFVARAKSSQELNEETIKFYQNMNHETIKFYQNIVQESIKDNFNYILMDTDYPDY